MSGASALRRSWWALVLAAALVAAGVVVARWPEKSGRTAVALGPVAQVQPVATGANGLATGPQIGNLAPNFLLETTGGDTLRLSDLRGRPVFVNFWATWCGECRHEMPAMQLLSAKYGAALAVAGVNVGEASAPVGAFAQRLGIGYSILLDRDKQVATAYAVPAIPSSFFVDADGVVQSVVFGELTQEEMEAHVQPLLR